MREEAHNNKWSGWKFFRDPNKLPELPAIYQIRCVTARLKPIPVCRVGGVDKEGILDIGESGDLRKRMRIFWGAAGKGNIKRKHSAGVTFVERNYQDIFPPDGLQFRYLIQDKSKTREAEKREIQDYIKRFRELPPLNSQK